jgi:DNA-binding MarR family transcriptional regulator
MGGVPQNPAVPLLVGLVRTIRDCCQQKEGEMCHKLALSVSQFACLLSIPEPFGELNVSQVAKTMRLSPSRVSRIVDSLVHHGLLHRRTMDSDRRTHLLALTSGGIEKWQSAHKLLGECEEHLLSKLSPHHLKELAETLRVLINVW